MTTEGYAEPPFAGDEIDTLLGSLERMRATFFYKAADLDADGLRHRIGSSELTLGRLLKHLAYIEDLTFTGELTDRPLPEPWASADEDERWAWVFTSADDDAPADLYAVWNAAVERSRDAIREFLAGHDAGRTFRTGTRDVTARRVLVDMIEEYGRHTGHADLLREDVDGRTGEDPPGPLRHFARDW